MQLIYAGTITYRLNIIGQHIEHIDKELIPSTKYITEITEHTLKQEVEFEKAFRYALEFDREPTAAQHFSDATHHFDQLSSKIEHELAASEAVLVKAVSHSSAATEREQLSQLLQQLASIKSKREQWTEHVHTVFDLLTNKQFHEAAQASQRVEHEASILETQIISALSEIELANKNAVHQLSTEDKNVLLIGIIMTLISLVITVSLTCDITNNLKRQLAALNQEISGLSQGNLSSKIRSELGVAFGMELMRKNLHTILTVVERSSSKILGASDELAQVCGEVNQSLEQQSLEINVISNAMIQLESSSSEVLQHAEDTQNSTKDVTHKSDENKQVTSQAMKSIISLTNIIQQTSDNILELEQQSNNITSVLGVIKGIADQTNLLALNAAIEAARAGEQGRGFAVVADEVRSLAQRTQQATIEIESMIGTLGQVTTVAVNSMSESSEYGKICLSSTEKSTQSISEIQLAINKIYDMNAQIAAAANQQSSNSQQLSNNTQKISDLTNRNAVSSAQLSVTAKEVSDIAAGLQNNLSKFKLC